MSLYPVMETDVNPYREQIQGRTNEPICVAGLLDYAKRILATKDEVQWSLEEIYDRLYENAPRIAIIGGSMDHPAHIMDFEIVAMAALRIWKNGGVPFYFSTPVMCDGTAQSNQGMSYSLQSRNVIAEMVINQMESHSYHGAFVIQSCDKQPFAIVSALAHLDYIRQRRGEAPVFATFAPAHVLKGGSIPENVKEQLEDLAQRAESKGEVTIAHDLRDTMKYILQCSANTSFQGIFERALKKHLLTKEVHEELEKQLSVYACDPKGGICAFNGTGNSSRHIISGFGLVHPSVELLTAPPTQAQIDTVIDSLRALINKREFSVSNILGANIKNAIRIHSASGGSTNLVMHIVGSMLYAGFDFDLWEMERIHQEVDIPDLFDYSLTEGRDIFALAQHCCSGKIRGMETLYYELMQNGVPMEVKAPTVTGQSWEQRLVVTKSLSAKEVKENPVILNHPRRSFSGVHVLKGNFFESAVVKISGMPSEQISEFDKKVSFVLYYEHEEAANENLLNPEILTVIKKQKVFAFELLKEMALFNAVKVLELPNLDTITYEELFDFMVDNQLLKITVIIASQGPKAFGMPEMFTPMQHINTNAVLKSLVTLMSDGRYSGVTRGAAVGHVTPEAMNKGGILYLQTGDLLYIHLEEHQIQFVDSDSFKNGNLVFNFEEVSILRQELGEERLERMVKRQQKVSAANRMLYHTDAAHGVVFDAIKKDATRDYRQVILLP